MHSFISRYCLIFCLLIFSGCLQAEIRTVDSAVVSTELLDTVGALKVISSSSAGVPGNASSGDMHITPDGHYAAFCSNSTNLTSDAVTSGGHAFLKDLRSGSIRIIDFNSSGVLSNGTANCQQVGISDDGNSVMWVGNPTNFGTGTAVSEVFVKNIATGVITIASTDVNGVSATTNSFNSQISADGRYVFFISSATNLLAGLNGSIQVFRKDLSTASIIAVNVDSAGTLLGNTWCFDASIDGLSVIFEKPSNVPDISLLHNIISTTTTTFTTSSTGVTANGDSTPACNIHTLHNGNNLAFTSLATNLDGGNGAIGHVFVKNMISGQVQMVDKSAAGVVANATSLYYAYSVSRDGTKVLFNSNATNLVTGVSGTQIYLKNLVDNSIIPVSTNSSGIIQNFGSTSYDQPMIFMMSDRYVSFSSTASNLDPSVTTTANVQLYLKRLQ